MITFVLAAITRGRVRRCAFAYLLAPVILVSCSAGSAVFGGEEAATSSGAIDGRRFAPFFDAFFAKEMKEFQVRGAVVVVVQGGQTVFSKGYGFADDAGTPVDPDHTIFRVGSVSKVVATLAVMQHVERQQLDLHEDANGYLTDSCVHLPRSVPAVSLHHLLTHTAGLDDCHIHLFETNPARVRSLRETLARRHHPLVHPPGEYYVYANWGIDIASHIVEESSGQSFARYAEDHILRPLGMYRSTFDPIPRPGNGVATGFYHRKGVRSVVPMPYLGETPSIALKAPAADMARLIADQLSDEPRTLRKSSVELMHKRQFGYHPLLSGVTYGYREYLNCGQRALVHPGIMPGFVSLICLLPDHDIGFFVACNNVHPHQSMNASVMRAFFAKFFPAPQPPRAPRPAAELQQYVGDYRAVSYSHDSFEKVASIFQHVPVRVGGDGVLLIKGVEWHQVGPVLFYRDGEYVTFREDSDGMSHLLMGFDAYEKLSAPERAPTQLGVVAGFAAAFSAACLCWPIALLIRLCRRNPPPRPRLPLAATILGFVSGSLNLAFLVSMGTVLARSDYYDFLYGMPTLIQWLLTLPLLTSGTAVALVLLAGRCWRTGEGGLFARLYLSLTAVTAAAFIPFLHYWNLIGFRY